MTPTPIEWTDLRWNPTRGCRRISPGCGGAAGEGGCYAERQAYRFSGPGLPYEGLVTLGKNGPRWTGKGRLVPETLAQPLSWKKPARVFVDSMSDLFFEEFSNEEIAAVFGVMAACPHLTFQVLTKRAQRMGLWFRWINEARDAAGGDGEVRRCLGLAASHGAVWSRHLKYPAWPLPNVHIGVSVENQEYADERIPWLLEVPAAVRFLSCEPLLGPIDLENVHPYYLKKTPPHRFDPVVRIDALRGHVKGPDDMLDERISWVIVGGESGPGSRPFHVEWARSIVQQCHAAEAAVFVKQLGAHVRWNGMSNPGEHWRGGTWSEDDGQGGFRVHLNDRKGGDWNEWPEDLRCREFPTTEVA